MKPSIVVPALGLCFSLAGAVDMTKYQPGQDVEPLFKSFLEELYSEAEDPKATDSFTNFFTSDGTLIVMANTAQGSAEIVELKQELLPTDGTKHWNHFPNTTTLSAETETQKVYEVWGVIQTTFDGGNCSQAYYESRFTVLKGDDGVPNLQAHAGTLVSYDDFVVSPESTPTDIVCEDY